MKAFNFTSNGKPVEVYAISTGTVAMKTKAHSIRHNNFVRRLYDIITDKEFTEDLPVYCWVIKHLEGVFLIDTGYSSRVNDPDYFKGAQAIEKWFSTTQVRTKVTKEQELLPQLNLLGITLDQIDFVILTHLHTDHVGGIPDMQGAKFLVNDIELQNNTQSFFLPKWFNPVGVKLEKNSVVTFPETYPLTSAGDMHMVSTPGHSKGHCSVLLQTDDVDILFAGDVMYDMDQLRTDTIAAPNELKTSLESYRRIKAYASERPTTVLPSHDKKSLLALARHSESFAGRENVVAC